MGILKGKKDNKEDLYVKKGGDKNLKEIKIDSQSVQTPPQILSPQS